MHKLTLALTLAACSLATGVQAATQLATDPKAFIPQGYVVVEELTGDLNKDGRPDYVFMVKGTDPRRVIEHEYRGTLDRNRRGLVIVFNRAQGYELALTNPEVFASENEDGGVYFAPDLELAIKRGNLYATYSHGRYGNWTYNFRHQNNDFELIGFDVYSTRGPTVLSEISINFSTRKMLEKENIHQNEEELEPVFKDTWTNFSFPQLSRLSEIKDIEELNIVDKVKGY